VLPHRPPVRTLRSVQNGYAAPHPFKHAVGLSRLERHMLRLLKGPHLIKQQDGIFDVLIMRASSLAKPETPISVL
jgi:hypothetical protein